MHQELLQLGATIKKRREERSLSLKEVENATSIRLSYLQAIEEGHLGKLISPIYAHGFITKYALFLELDAEKLLKEHPYVLKILSEKQSLAQEFTLGIGTLEVRGSPGGEVKWLPNFIWVGVSVVVILTGWFLARYLGIF
jgi:cytoskeletal protein RodZ